jgi:hypothetical protein
MNKSMTMGITMSMPDLEVPVTVWNAAWHVARSPLSSRLC